MPLPLRREDLPESLRELLDRPPPIFTYPDCATCGGRGKVRIGWNNIGCGPCHWRREREKETGAAHPFPRLEDFGATAEGLGDDEVTFALRLTYLGPMAPEEREAALAVLARLARGGSATEGERSRVFRAHLAAARKLRREWRARRVA